MNTVSAVTVDWKFWIGDVLIPIVTFVIGLFVGKAIERNRLRNKTIVKGTSNTVIQTNTIKPNPEVDDGRKQREKSSKNR